MRSAVVTVAVAVISGVVGFLIGRAASPTSAESAIRNHQNWRLRLYLLQEGNPNASTEVGRLLDYALGEKGNEEAALILIRAGASIDYSWPGPAPLESAMLACRPAIVSALLAADGIRDAATIERARAIASCPAGQDLLAKFMASNTSLERTRGR